MKWKVSWGTAISIFFVLFFIWVFGFVIFALRQSNDLVSDDYYQKGATYSDQIKINQRSAAYQDSLQITTEGNQIQLLLCKSLTSENDSVQVYFFRSSDKAKDLSFGFKKADSPLIIEKSLLNFGRYQIFISWASRGEKFMVKKTVDIE